MNPRLLAVLILLPGLVFSQTAAPTVKTKGQVKINKEGPRSAAGSDNLAKVPDQSYYDQLNNFLFPKAKKEKLSTTEQILGGIAGAASAACAGIAAVQWMDARAKDEKTKEAAAKNTNK